MIKNIVKGLLVAGAAKMANFVIRRMIEKMQRDAAKAKLNEAKKEVGSDKNITSLKLDPKTGAYIPE